MEAKVRWRCKSTLESLLAPASLNGDKLTPRVVIHRARRPKPPSEETHPDESRRVARSGQAASDRRRADREAGSARGADPHRGGGRLPLRRPLLRGLVPLSAAGRA